VVVRHALGPVLQVVFRPFLELLLTHGGAEVVDLALVQRFVLCLGGVHLHSTYGVNCHDRTLECGLIIISKGVRNSYILMWKGGFMCAPPKKVEEKKKEEEKKK
jgi:hypothetical protein